MKRTTDNKNNNNKKKTAGQSSSSVEANEKWNKLPSNCRRLFRNLPPGLVSAASAFEWYFPTSNYLIKQNQINSEALCVCAANVWLTYLYYMRMMWAETEPILLMRSHDNQFYTGAAKKPTLFQWMWIVCVCVCGFSTQFVSPETGRWFSALLRATTPTVITVDEITGVWLWKPQVYT